ncbi:MAG: filamentous hemagglutinin N-terminal domain-containing protein [Rhizobacter sp.]
MQLHLHHSIPAALTALLATLPLYGAAQPVSTQLPALKTGGAQINATVAPPVAATMNITQSTSTGNRALLEWTSFSIGSAAKVNIVQPNAQSVLVNRVVGAGGTSPIGASEIYGSMNANGRVFLINPTGIVFGPGAQVNVGSLVATTLDLTDPMMSTNYQSLMAGDPVQLIGATSDTGTSLSVLPANVIQVPQIQVTDKGSILLLSRNNLSQGGTISAPSGQINLSTAQQATLIPVGTSGFVEVAMAQSTKVQTGVSTLTNSFTVANSGSIVIGAQDKDEIPRGDTLAITSRVITDAIGGSGGDGGSIRIGAGANGSVTLTPESIVSASNVNGSGGTIAIQGGSIVINGGTSATTNTSWVWAEGKSGGGSVTIGGSGTRSLSIQPNTVVSADATNSGNGGSVSALATFNINSPVPVARSTFGVAEIYGDLRARGGTNGGNGGTIETSGAAITTSLLNTTTGVTTTGTMNASARGARGTAGSWTLDPFDVTISSAPTSSTTSVFTPTGPGANVNAADISAALNAGTNVTIATDAGGNGNAAGNITFTNATVIQRTAGTAATSLTLQANNNITMTGSGIATSAGPVNVRFVADSDGSGAGGINITGSIGTGGGTLELVGGTDPNAGAAISANGGVVLGAGTIDTRGATGGAGAVTIRGRSTLGSASPGVSLGSTFNVGNMSVQGSSSNGTGVSLNGANITTSSGLIDIRGGGTRANNVTAQVFGVNVGISDIQLGTGSLLIAGRGDDANLATFGNATGLSFNDLRISAATNSTGTITLIGQATGGSQASGIVAAQGGNSGLVINSAANTAGSPATGANIVIGASTSATASPAMTLGASIGPRIATTGSINYRPLGVDATGAITEQPTTPISVLSPAAAASAPGGGFVVSTALLQSGTTASVTADKGIVIGSSLHSGLITLEPGALDNPGNLSLTLQNQGAGSAGISVGGNSLDTLGLMSSGNITQNGALSVQNLVLAGGSTSTFTLNDPNNAINVLAFDPPASLEVQAQGLTIDAATASSFNAGLGNFAPLSITDSIGGDTLLLQSSGNVRINRSISMAGTGAPQIDIVAAQTGGIVTFANGTTLSAGSGGRWQIWAPTVVNPPTQAQTQNLYGCVFGDTTSCSASGIPISATANQMLHPVQPALTVVADDVTGTAGSALPALSYTTPTIFNNDPAPTFLNGDTAATALSGTLATTATSASPPGTYAVTAGSLTSPLGYIIQFNSSTLTLEQGAPVAFSGIGGFTRQVPLTGFMSELSSDVYGRNLAQPYICTAASTIRGTVGPNPNADPLSSEWGKVRNQPQLSGCVNVNDSSSCSAF